MKKLCLLLIAAIIAFPVFGQSQKGYVYLKNGTILKGKYRYTEDLSKLQIESAGNLWLFDADEIDRVTSKKSQFKAYEDQTLNSPFLLRTEIGVLVGNSSSSQSAPFSFTSALNYDIIPKLSVGAGIGLEFLKETYLPVFVNMEYKLRNSYSMPFVFLKTGYQVPIEDTNPIYNYEIQPLYYDFMPWPYPNNYNQTLEAKGGFMINPGIGYQRMFSSGFGMSFAFGYQF
ncbi:MAG TPA: hypothetical protein VLA03_07420, partial [Draconibacterium sp.]|nr:hypothetical protein [Draconibacterium sp.]